MSTLKLQREAREVAEKAKASKKKKAAAKKTTTTES